MSEQPCHDEILRRLDQLECELREERARGRLRNRWTVWGVIALLAGLLSSAAVAAVDSIILYTRDAPAGVDKVRFVIPTDGDPVTCRFENSSVNLVSGGLETAGAARLTNAGALTTITGYTQTTGTSATTSSATAGTAVSISGATITTGTGLDVSVTGGATGSYAAKFSGGKLRLPTFALAAEPPVASSAAGDVYWDSTNHKLRVFQPAVGGGVTLWRNQGAELLTEVKSTAATAIPVAWTTLGAGIGTSAPGLYVACLGLQDTTAGTSIGLRIRDTAAGVTRAKVQLADSTASQAGFSLVVYDKTTTVAETLAVQWVSSAANTVRAGDVIAGETLNSVGMDFLRLGR